MATAKICNPKNSLVSEGSRIEGTVRNSVLGGGVIVEKGAIVEDSVIMEDVVIKKNAKVYTAIIDSNTTVNAGATVGKAGANKEDIVVVASGSVIKK